MQEHYFVGVDLGQKRDYTAIGVVQRSEERTEFDWVEWRWGEALRQDLRHLERLELGTSYVEVAARVREVTRSAKLAGRCTVVADETGVGAPVIELLGQAGLGCQVVPVTITCGDRASRAGSGFHVPKRDLVVGLQVMFEAGALRIADRLRGRDILLKELTEMRVRTGAAGQESMAAWREGEHDDLVLAVALACWWGRQRGVAELGVGRDLGMYHLRGGGRFFPEEKRVRVRRSVVRAGGVSELW